MEHWDITRMNTYGTLATEEEEEPVCPVCGKKCEDFYKYNNEIVGCDMCIKKVDAYEEMSK